MTRQPVPILDNSSGEVIHATLLDGLTATLINQTERVWHPLREQLAQDLLSQGLKESELPQHLHWNWLRKAPFTQLASFRAFGIEHDGKIQGMMLVDIDGHSARLPPDEGRPLIYVDYIETAPWNLAGKELTNLLPPPKFLLIGKRFLEVAVQLSRSFEYRGRIGLHALPQSEDFYRKQHFQFVSNDASKQNLPYYELTRALADAHWTEKQP